MVAGTHLPITRIEKDRRGPASPPGGGLRRSALDADGQEVARLAVERRVRAPFIA